MRRYLSKGINLLRGERSVSAPPMEPVPAETIPEVDIFAAVPAIDPIYSDTPSLGLTRGHLQDARLFATRHDMVREIGVPQGASIVEIGVAEGNFSEFMLKELKPARFVAFDLFDLHDTVPKLNAIFEGRTHAEFYSQRLERFRNASKIDIVEGDSSTQLASHPGDDFDMIYIDGDHRLPGVIKDAEASITRLKPDGILIFNDYIMHDHIANMRYGVVEVVNNLCVNRGWRVIGLALQHDMFCDIALVRGPDVR